LRPLPLEEQRELFNGVMYFRSVRRTPRPLIIHGIQVNLHADGIRFLVTPGDPEAELPLKARTTDAFLDEFNVQVAVNGDGFTPWRSNTLWDYYPHSGDPVTPLGLAASQGIIYSNGQQPNHATLYVSEDNTVTFREPEEGIYNAISGSWLLVHNGQVMHDLPNDHLHPRTAMGITQNRDTLLIFVVDGRQPGYSEGVTLVEMAEIAHAYGAHEALNLDGGGSSTLVMEGIFGWPVAINSPIDLHIPGRQRPVGNHLGIFAQRR
jgi:exopolysaccharide biosynthesis protein